MKISTQGRYGLRAMVDLAKNDKGGPIPIRKIAERQEISEKYLEQLFAKLRKEGLIESVRGAYGGYKLNNMPADITVGDIIRTLEGSIAPVECVEGDGEECNLIHKCVAQEVWNQVYEKVNEVIDSITLKQLQERAVELERNENQGYVYHI
jgi:Rrf2 family protein